MFNVGNGGNAAYITFMNAVTNNSGATFTIDGSYVTFAGTFTNNGTLVSDPSTIIFDALFTGTGTITPSAGDTYEFLGVGANTIKLGGKSIDIATLILGQGATLNITDGSLTVNELIDPTGSDTGITGTFTADSYGMSTSLPGGTPTPLPGAILLLGSGLAGDRDATKKSVEVILAHSKGQDRASCPFPPVCEHEERDVLSVLHYPLSVVAHHLRLHDDLCLLRPQDSPRPATTAIKEAVQPYCRRQLHRHGHRSGHSGKAGVRKGQRETRT